jgi:hypothetical protein
MPQKSTVKLWTFATVMACKANADFCFVCSIDMPFLKVIGRKSFQQFNEKYKTLDNETVSRQKLIPMLHVCL